MDMSFFQALIFCAICHYGSAQGILSAEAVFDTNGVRGYMRFYQGDLNSNTDIHIELTGLDKMAGSWHVHENALGGSTNCADAGGHFNPTGAVAGSIEEVGNPEGRINSRTDSDVASLIGLSSYSQTLKDHADGHVQLQGAHNITGRSIVIHKADNTRWICADILVPRKKMAKAVFQDDGVQGQIIFTQQGIYTETTIDIQLDGLVDQGNWTVNTYPVPTSGCSNVGGIFTVNGGKVGDMIGRLGSAAAVTNDDSTVVDYATGNVELNGPSNIIGRSVVIYKSDGTRWVCADIVEPNVAGQKTATATFQNNDFEIEGTVTFRQDGALLETEIFVDLWGLQGRALDWMVHTGPVPSMGDCLDTGDTHSSGNLTSRFGDFGGLNSIHQPYTDTYPQGVSLFGSDSILGRSLIIFDTNGNRMVCASIVEKGVLETRAKANFDGMAGVIGYVRFLQVGEGNPTAIEWHVAEGLNGEAGDWHIHERDITEAEPCVNAQGHYNPHGVDGAIKGNEIGDLSGRFERLDDKDNWNVVLIDDKSSTDTQGNRNNADLSGNYAVMGKSLILHNADDYDSIWVCASIVEEVFVPDDGDDPNNDNDEDDTGPIPDSAARAGAGFFTLGVGILALLFA